MAATASPQTRSSYPAINTMAPGDRRVLNENELAQRWGVSPKTLQRWRSTGQEQRVDTIAEEVPVAMRYNGAAFSVMMARSTLAAIRYEVSTSWPSTRPASAARARPVPMDAATSATVTGPGNWRWEPSGSVIWGMFDPSGQQKSAGVAALRWVCGTG